MITKVHRSPMISRVDVTGHTDRDFSFLIFMPNTNNLNNGYLQIKSFYLQIKSIALLYSITANFKNQTGYTYQHKYLDSICIDKYFKSGAYYDL
jgi:hypothetical protein